MTSTGQQIINIANDIFKAGGGIKQLARDHNSPETGSLSVATTHTQARYILPRVIRGFDENTKK